MGCGLVSVIGTGETLKGLRPRLLAEIMTLEFSQDFYQKNRGAVLVMGPGMGLNSESELSLKQAFQSKIPLVLDADALTLLPKLACRTRKESVTVLTPHPKEAADLLGISVDEVEKDRYQAAKKLAEAYQCFIVLKGKGTLITSPNDPIIVVTAGDSGLSKGGTGDLLAGIIGANLAQKMSPIEAIPLSVYLHGRASELLSESLGHTVSSLASEIGNKIPDAIREVMSGKND